MTGNRQLAHAERSFGVAAAETAVASKPFNALACNSRARYRSVSFSSATVATVNRFFFSSRSRGDQKRRRSEGEREKRRSTERALATHLGEIRTAGIARVV